MERSGIRVRREKPRIPFHFIRATLAALSLGLEPEPQCYHAMEAEDCVSGNRNHLGVMSTSRPLRRSEAE